VSSVHGRDGRFVLMIQLGKPKTVDRAQIERVRDAVEAMLPSEYDDVAVMVNQVECKEPGCAPIETIVSLLIEKAPLKFTVFKPVADVAVEDLREGLVAIGVNPLAPEAPQ